MLLTSALIRPYPVSVINTPHNGAQQEAGEWHRRMHWRRTSPQSCLRHSPCQGGDNAVLVILAHSEILCFSLPCGLQLQKAPGSGAGGGV